MPQNNGKKSGKAASEFTKLTPLNLVRKQVENEDFHVSEEDMKNLNTSLQTPDSEAIEFKNEAEDNGKEKITTSYDILDKYFF